MPYVDIATSEEGDLLLAGGIFADIFQELSRSLNFFYTVITPPDGEWGRVKSDGTWSGMVGQLEAKKVDFGMVSTY